MTQSSSTTLLDVRPMRHRQAPARSGDAKPTALFQWSLPNPNPIQSHPIRPTVDAKNARVYILTIPALRFALSFLFSLTSPTLT